MVIVLLLLAPFLLQEKHYIPKANKAPYMEAVADYRDAVDLFEDGGYVDSIEILDAILGNKKVRKRDCILRIEESAGNRRNHDFFPHQLRGRAWLVRARNTGQNTTAILYLERAEKDLKESIRRGLRSSRGYLDEVEKELKERKKAPSTTPPPVKKDPEPEFRTAWRELIDKNDYAGAKNWIESKGGFLSPEKRSTYLDNTGRECRAWLDTKTEDFLGKLEQARTPVEITRPGSVAFRRTFSLPNAAQLAVTTPTYEWCIAVGRTLEALRTGKDVLQPILDHALAAVPLVPEGENGLYRWAEGMARFILEKRLTGISERAKEAPRERREALRKESNALRDQWERFETAVQEAAKESPSFLERLRPWKIDELIRFPRAYPGIDTLAERLRESLADEQFKRALQKYESKLRNPGENLTLESRREILRYRIAAGALLQLYEDKSVEEAAESLGELGARLKILGGSFEMDEFGPRVEKVFLRLGRDS